MEGGAGDDDSGVVCLVLRYGLPEKREEMGCEDVVADAVCSEDDVDLLWGELVLFRYADS